MPVTGHKPRSVSDRNHIVSGADRVEAVRRLVALQGFTAPAPRRL